MIRFFLTALLLTAGQAFALQCEQSEVVTLNAEPVMVHATGDGVMVLRELGRELEYFDYGQWRPIALPGTRLGQLVMPVNAFRSVLVRTVDRNGGAKLSVAMPCNGEFRSELAWYQQAQAIAETYDSSAKVVRTLEPLERLRASASTLRARALVSHLSANVHFLRGETLQAEQLFLESERQWRAIQDPMLAASALLGAADLASRRSDFTASVPRSLQATAQFKALGLPYFQTRSEENICKQSFAQGDYPANTVCLSRVLQSYQLNAEQIDETNTLINLGTTQKLAGLPVDLSLIQSKIAVIREQQKLNLYRGRLHLLSAHVHRDKGELSQALAEFQNALLAFEQATEEGDRWRVATLGHVADLHFDLGLHEQGFAMLREALALASVQNVPARTASVWFELGRGHKSIGDLSAAERWFRQAAEIQLSLGLKTEYQLSTLELLSVIELDPRVALERLDALGPIAPRYRIQAELLRAELLRRSNQTVAARAIESGLDVRKLTAKQAKVHALFAAKLASSSQEANKVLLDYFESIANSADAAPIMLAYMSVRQISDVRRAWVDQLDVRSKPADVFKAALLTLPQRYLTPPLAKSPTNPGVPVSQVADSPTHPSNNVVQPRINASVLPSLETLQNKIPEQTSLLILLPGNKRSVALWVTRTSAEIIEIEAAKQLEQKLSSLLAAVSSPSSSKLALEGASTALSDTIFARRSGAPPAQLWVVADELSAAIPFSVLQWPGSQAPLVNTTAVSLIAGLVADDTSNKPREARTLVYFSPDYKTSKDQLEFAALERAQLGSSTLHVETTASATRSNYLANLQLSGSWLHVSAHGRANPGVMGDAGLWLNGSAENRADFLSWLDVINYRTRASLVVLSACQSAQGAQPSRQSNVSFALATSGSGAEHVIAALWPVSDVATKTWVPDFYQALSPARHLDDTTLALQTAQRSLVRSPHFRHPFYWASMVHFHRVTF